jgi:hypothetical protein
MSILPQASRGVAPTRQESLPRDWYAPRAGTLQRILGKWLWGPILTGERRNPLGNPAPHICGAVHFGASCESTGSWRASVRHTDACHSRGARGTDGEHPQPGTPQTAEGDGGEPGVRLLTRSKRGTRFRTASLVGGTRQRKRLFCSPGVGRNQRVRHSRWRSPENRNWLNSKPRRSREIIMVDRNEVNRR